MTSIIYRRVCMSYMHKYDVLRDKEIRDHVHTCRKGDISKWEKNFFYTRINSCVSCSKISLRYCAWLWKTYFGETKMLKAAEKRCIQRIVPTELLGLRVAVKLKDPCLSTLSTCILLAVTIQIKRIFETQMPFHVRVDDVMREIWRYLPILLQN